MCDHNIHLMRKKKNLHDELVKKKIIKKNYILIFFLCIKSTRVGPILLGSAGYRKQGNYFVWLNVFRVHTRKHKSHLNT